MSQVAIRKPVNPYITLRDQYADVVQKAQEWVRTVTNAPETCTFYYPKESVALGDKYTVADVKERVIVADQLGYDTVLKWNPDKGLMVILRKRPPMAPWEIRP